MKTPFTLEAWLKDKSQKVETRDGRPVKIISFELTDTNDCPIAAQFRLCAGTPVVYLFDENGEYRGEGASDYDLFIITPEPELSEFEKAVGLELFDAPFEERHIKVIKEESAILLDLARKELVKEGTSKNEMGTMMYDAGFEDGKEEALKDLPRWRKWENGACGNGRGIPLAIVKRGLNGYELVDALGIQGEQYIMLSDLEKLPGFNE